MAKRYPGASGLAHPSFDSLADIRKLAILRDEFTGGGLTTTTIGELGWTLTGTGGTAAVSGAVDHPGIVTLTAATTGFAAGMSLAADVVFLHATVPTYVAFVFRIPTALTNREVRFGLADAAPTAARPAAGVSFEYDAAVDADDFTVTATNAASTTATAVADLAAPLAATWYAVEIAATTGSVMAWLNGEPVIDPIAVAANIPDATDGLTPYAYVGDGTNGQTLEVDAFMMRIPMNRAGFTTY